MPARATTRRRNAWGTTQYSAALGSTYTSDRERKKRIAEQKREQTRAALDERRGRIAEKKLAAQERLADAKLAALDKKIGVAEKKIETAEAKVSKGALTEAGFEAVKRHMEAEIERQEAHKKAVLAKNPSFGYGVYKPGIFGEEQLQHFSSKPAAETWARSSGITGYTIKRAFAKNPRYWEDNHNLSEAQTAVQFWREQANTLAESLKKDYAAGSPDKRYSAKIHKESMYARKRYVQAVKRLNLLAKKQGKRGLILHVDSSELNPCADTRKKAVTDRAKRYRANQPGCKPAGKKQCKICHSKRFLTVDHIDGNEANGAKSNLRWLCKSCNTRLGAEMARSGVGQRTDQYNPGATSAAQYARAVATHESHYVPGVGRVGEHDASGLIIHETPKSKRREYASEIWASRHAHGTAGRGGGDAPDWVTNPDARQRSAALMGTAGGSRRNPETADDEYEQSRKIAELFHGRPVKEEITVTEPMREHDWLWRIGPLVKLKVKTVRKQRATFPFSQKEGSLVHLMCSPDGRQMYLRDGDQEISLEPLGMDGEDWKRDKIVIGEIKEITYRDRKKFYQFKDTDFYHFLGEETKVKPWLVYDTMNKKLEIVGGQYWVETRELVDGMSPGLRN